MEVVNTTSMNFSSIETLNGSNYKKWKQDIEILLGLMDYDLAIREEEPAALTVESTAEQKAKFEKWEKSNMMGLLIMKKAMTETVRGGIPTCNKAKDFLEAIGEKFKESEKDKTGNFLTSLTTMKFDGTTGVREHILKMADTAGKLKERRKDRKMRSLKK
ncbi:uncharacterized protein LOC126606288 [Malus sylvestris]|uniref:uncharacterized protein LOC126606288 n=1 Tax=Malus sylvestris TaxID=3752 RepID=UPI0021AD0FB1|nr:uncharacterized protein LOC126606288 [Malus sylvestris]XP_050129614.1 uncharacterized protein LOC126606288 [Malus sylvestris]XP_050129615.1 uncharacterized protein LOC126606288 [Malus sylvestris]XP_050129616.1 uncharacterized protein LOC126606288 [Malus sylvestris]